MPLTHFKFNTDGGEQFVAQNKDVIKAVGNIIDVNLKEINSAYRQPGNIPFDRYRYLVYGTNGNAVVTILMEYTDSSKENIHKIDLVNIKSDI